MRVHQGVTRDGTARGIPEGRLGASRVFFFYQGPGHPTLECFGILIPATLGCTGEKIDARIDLIRSVAN